MQGKGEDHLAFPDGDGGEYAGLDFFRQRPVVALDDAYLRRGLHRDGPRKLQIVQPPLETVDLLRKVADLLRLHEIAGRIRLRLEARQFHSSRLFQFALARFNVRRQFRVEPRIVLIEHLKRLDVAEQADHGLVQLVDDDFDLFRKGVELRHRALGGREQRAHKRQRLEEPRRAHDFRDVHILHFEHKVGERFAELPGILGLHAGKEIVREPGDALHGFRPVRDGQGGIGEVYRIGDGCDALLLSRRGDNNRGGRCFHNRLSFIRQYASQYQSGSGTARTPCPSQ